MDLVDAMQLAARATVLQRNFQLAELPRLREMTGGPGAANATAHLEARFHLLSTDAAIAGRVTATLRGICQRCLRPVEIAVEDEFHVAVMASEAEFDRLPEAQDAVLADPSRLDLAWLTEEQLLLAMPLVPLHKAGECGTTDPKSTPRTKPDSAADSQQPFANLRELLKKR